MKKFNYLIVRSVLRRLKYYLIAFAAFLLIFFIATAWLINKIKSTEAEVAKLKQLSFINLNQVDHQTVLELEKDAVKLSSFLPDELNVYQVIDLIEEIARKTKFTIQSYSLHESDVEANRLHTQPLSLTGSGTIEQLMSFIEEYKFITGKIITIDSVNLSGGTRVLSNLVVNIYAYKPEITVASESIRSLDKTDQLILKKIRKYYRPYKKIVPDTKYEKKENPFK
jgi:hypothetical protein